MQRFRQWTNSTLSTIHPCFTCCPTFTQLTCLCYSYPKKVTVEVVPTPVPFPSISICNMRNLDVHVLNTLNRMFLQDDRPFNNINKTEQAFIRAYMKKVAKYAPLFWKYQDQYAEVGELWRDCRRLGDTRNTTATTAPTSCWLTTRTRCAGSNDSALDSGEDDTIQYVSSV